MEVLIGPYYKVEDFSIIKLKDPEPTYEVKGNILLEDPIKVLKDFAKLQPTAIGIAANQIEYQGVPLTQKFFLFVSSDLSLKGAEWKIAINPVIVKYYGFLQEKKEYCLSWPGHDIIAQRYPALQFKYYDEKGDLILANAKGLMAQVVQHEMGHLDCIPEVKMPYDKHVFRKINIGRNDQCPCKSGKKYKNCCIIYK